MTEGKKCFDELPQFKLNCLIDLEFSKVKWVERPDGNDDDYGMVDNIYWSAKYQAKLSPNKE